MANPFAQALRENRLQLGLWQALASPYAAEVCAGAGFDWLMFDAEHAPNTAQTLLGQIQAVGAHALEPVVRPPSHDRAILKQLLDLGFRTVLVPMVDSAEEARAIVAATRFPPVGVRGVASATSRASGFGRVPDYLTRTQDDICLLAQIESAAALEEIEAIAAVPGIGGLFIGPGDLAASLGFLGNPRHPTVQAAIDDAIARIRHCGKPAGVFALDAEDARRRIGQGATFVSLGTDIGLLAGGAAALLAAVRTGKAAGR